MQVIKKDLLCRVARDYRSKALSIRKLVGLDREVAYAVCQELGISPEDIHNQTCVVAKHDTKSITGDNYLAAKALKLTVLVVVADCQLIDDREAKPEPPSISTT